MRARVMLDTVGPLKLRSNGRLPGPRIVGSADSVVSTLASRYSGERTMLA